ncbi:MAG: hypothetical protein JWO03_3307 [Bacteroidetes bacterium]|nr:hypothetical protein [Bacteroidota bacterium]
MKNIKSIVYLSAFVAAFFYTGVTKAQSSAEQEKAKAKFDAQVAAKYNERVVANAQVGSLICTDAHGKYVVCTGSDYEKVKGFATSVPYVTINKAVKGEKPNEFKAIASLQGGAIKAGDRVCASTVAGQVKKCSEMDVPYAIALSDASADATVIKVKVLNLK